MSPRRTVTLLTTALLLAMTTVATAQPTNPTPLKDIKNGRPWTYVFANMILAAAVALLLAVVVGYLVKSREFRANQKRGGAK